MIYNVGLQQILMAVLLQGTHQSVPHTESRVDPDALQTSRAESADRLSASKHSQEFVHLEAPAQSLQALERSQPNCVCGV